MIIVNTSTCGIFYHIQHKENHLPGIQQMVESYFVLMRIQLPLPLGSGLLLAFVLQI
jgi:hypothetical protein